MGNIAVDPRASIIRNLAKDIGLTAKKLSDLPPETLALFHAASPSELHSHIMAAIGLCAQSRHIKALTNALNIGTYSSGSLTVRRATHLATANVTERSLIRHEAKGAEELLAQIDFYATSIRPTLKADLGLDDASNDAQIITALRSEILRLRTIIANASSILGES